MIVTFLSLESVKNIITSSSLPPFVLTTTADVAEAVSFLFIALLLSKRIETLLVSRESRRKILNLFPA